ncbi:chromosome segregation protein SMC [Aureibacter tunicatorum]|uniref:Cell division protein ZapB n=1 Tax=Aureibacter tunicatorum TaxID=866807 RepID=A0AAE3XR53_9BACT|nr:chromosome segregation protein SMC [Aureibacter tunicatorum]MDR6239914.1 cell division protein ZapB [Aureibacter tunicatorum]BDD04389.1 hypothetical protein AUTU_18720 [Aureibacter tunicatorum]
MSLKEEHEANIIESKKNNKKNFIIIFAVLLIVLLGANLYYNYQLREEKDFIESELNLSKNTIDELTNELDEKIAEVEELGGDVEDLRNAKEELEEEKRKLQSASDYTYRQLKEARKIIAGHKELLKQKDKEIAKLKEVNETLHEENVQLKEDKNKLNKSISDLNDKQSELNSKIKTASRLQAEKITLFAINEKGKEREGDVWRKRHTFKIKTQFGIADNKVAPIEIKEILLRIVDTNTNQVIFDVAKGSGTFMLDGEEEFYTAKQEILFDNSGQEITFLYDKGTEFDRGNYKIELYTDGYLMGVKSFTIK